MALLSLKFILTGLGNWYQSGRLIQAGVLGAENAGFSSVVFPDQYMWDPADLGVDTYEGIDSTLDTWHMLAFISAKTETIRLGTWVTPIPFRPPGLLAKTVATLDQLSQGRAILGVGAGVSQRMFEAYAQWDPPRIRVDKTREGLELILRLWSEKKVDYDGRYYKAKGAVLESKPVQKPHPPLLFGGSGRKMLQLAGKSADICYIPPWNKMSHQESKRIVLDAAKHYNRQERISFAYAHTPLGPADHYDRAEYGKHVEEAQRGGFEYFITAFSLTAPPWDSEASSPKGIDTYLKCLRDFADSFIPSYDK